MAGKEEKLNMSGSEESLSQVPEGDEDPKVLISSFRRKRGTHKSKITIYLKKLMELKNDDRLTSSFCKNQIKAVEEELSQIKKFDEHINSLMETYALSVDDEHYYNDELDNQAEYLLEIGLELDQYEEITSNISGSSGNVSTDKLLDVVSRLNFSDGKPLPLECGTFSGKEEDKFAFHTFLNQFNNVIGSRKNLSDSAKQTYLYGYLRDYALKVVKHLTISDSNYLLAIQMLKQEFLDVNYIIDETYKNILKAAPSVDYDPEYTSSKMYLNEMRSYLHELKTHNIDLLQDRTAGHSLISHIVFNKLPVNLRRELIHRTSNNYPSLNEVFCHYNEAIKTLKKTTFLKKKTGNKQFSKQSTVTGNSSSNSSSNSSKSKNKGETKSTMQNFKSVNTKVNQLTCKLCSAEGHSISRRTFWENVIILITMKIK